MEADKSKDAKWQHGNCSNERLELLVTNTGIICCPTDMDKFGCLLPDILEEACDSLEEACDSLEEAPRVIFFAQTCISFHSSLCWVLALLSPGPIFWSSNGRAPGLSG